VLPGSWKTFTGGRWRCCPGGRTAAPCNQPAVSSVTTAVSATTSDSAIDRVRRSSRTVAAT
jgi:hypothetical protein